MSGNNHFELNSRNYRIPERPVVIVCVDGGDPRYLEAGLKRGRLPTIARMIEDGFYSIALGTVPSFTCPNNMSIVTGSEPAIHGISGNFFLDPQTGEPIVMTGPELLRSSTVLAEFAKRGCRVVSITAKDKLRQQLQKGVDLSKGNISFSAQMAGQCSVEENGIADVTELVGMPEPDMYSAELSLFVMEAGVKLLERDPPALMYLSLTDYIQHKHAPEEPEALEFYERLDDAFARLLACGAVLGITADHGMNDKANDRGEPNVIWLQDHLDRVVGRGRSRVICPITDPFVAHHGALGGLVRVYLDEPADLGTCMAALGELEGIESVWSRTAAVRHFQLAEDREGDILVLSDAATCIGARADDHDLTGLAGHRLRTHGGLAEADVPFIVSEPLSEDDNTYALGNRLRSNELIWMTLNAAAA